MGYACIIKIVMTGVDQRDQVDQSWPKLTKDWRRITDLNESFEGESFNDPVKSHIDKAWRMRKDGEWRIEEREWDRVKVESHWLRLKG